MWHGYGYLDRDTDRIEIWNNERVLAYLAGDCLGTSGFEGLGHKTTTVNQNCGCQTLYPLYCDKPDGDPIPDHFTSPASDPAPWYDPDSPESAEFAGLFVETVTGFDSTVSRSVTDAAIQGGSLGPLRFGVRTLTVTGWLRAKTCCAAEFGLRWLTEALTGGTCDNCALGELTMFRCCAPDDETNWIEPVNPQTQFNPVQDAEFTVTDLGGGLYTLVFGDGFPIGWASDPGGPLNNFNGYIQTALNGVDPLAIATLSVGPSPGGPSYNLSIPFGLLTGAVLSAIYLNGATATLTVDTTAALSTALENEIRDELAAVLAEWVTDFGSGVLVISSAFSAGHTYTLGDGPNPFNYERAMLRTGLVDGPTVTERAGTCCESCGCTDLRVQFTLASETPFIFGPIDWCLLDQPFFTEEFWCLDLFCRDCPPVGTDAVLESECVSESAITPPPNFQPTNPCYCDPWVQYRMCCGLENDGDWNEAASIIKVFTGSARMLNMKIEGFINPFPDRPCPCDPDDVFWKCRQSCSVIEIGSLPSGSTLTIDSRTRVSTLELPGGRVVGGTRFITGEAGVPFEWLDMAACSALCILITVDANHVADNATVSIGAAKRFLASGG